LSLNISAYFTLYGGFTVTNMVNVRIYYVRLYKNKNQQVNKKHFCVQFWLFMHGVILNKVYSEMQPFRTNM